VKIDLKEIPQKTGVYLFCDKSGHVIYIGKAINLRKRVSQYFTAGRKRMHYRTQQMISNIANVKWSIEESELHALLMEDRLIKRHWPIYNRRQKKFLRNRYVTWSQDDFPRLRVHELMKRPPGKTVFGPFPDEYFVSDLFEIVHELYPIRYCNEAIPLARCTNRRFRNCSAPCQENITREEYAAIVNQVTDFLRGNTDDGVRMLQNQIAESAKSLDFERAAKLRDQMMFCERFMRRQEFYDQFRTKNLLIKLAGPSTTMYLFHKGNLVDFFRDHPPEDGFLEVCARPREGIEEPGTEPDWILRERANVVYAWLQTKGPQKAYRFI
jgi:excinuclease ABC subunit C